MPTGLRMHTPSKSGSLLSAFLAVIICTSGCDTIPSPAGTLTNERITSVVTSYRGSPHFDEAGQVRFIDFQRTEGVQKVVDDQGMRFVSQLSSVRWLNLAGTDVTDSGVEHLTQIRGLTLLVLSSTGVTDRGITYLQRLPELQHLSLVFVPVTDKSIETLSKLQRLEYLDLRGTRITKHGAERLEKLLPKCEVRYGDA